MEEKGEEGEEEGEEVKEGKEEEEKLFNQEVHQRRKFAV